MEVYGLPFCEATAWRLSPGAMERIREEAMESLGPLDRIELLPTNRPAAELLETAIKDACHGHQ